VGMRLSCNFVNVYTIAYRVGLHEYPRASLLHSPNANQDSSNRISRILTLHTTQPSTARSALSLLLGYGVYLF